VPHYTVPICNYTVGLNIVLLLLILHRKLNRPTSISAGSNCKTLQPADTAAVLPHTDNLQDPRHGP
jgi:hypothetical protein